MKLKNDDGDGKLRILKTPKDINLKSEEVNLKKSTKEVKKIDLKQEILRKLRTY